MAPDTTHCSCLFYRCFLIPNDFRQVGGCRPAGAGHWVTGPLVEPDRSSGSGDKAAGRVGVIVTVTLAHGGWNAMTTNPQVVLSGRHQLGSVFKHPHVGLPGASSSTHLRRLRGAAWK